jgi:predicted LPLAT superfamily acyltransferase
VRVHSEDARQAPEQLTGAGGTEPKAESPRAALSWDGRSYGGGLGNRIFLATIRAAGRWPTYLLLALVVPYYCLIARSARRASRAYLDRVLGPAGFFRSLARAYRHFFEFGQVLVDRFIFYARAGSFEFDRTGWERIEAALAHGKGAIFLSAHLGGWELASAVRRGGFSSERRLPVPLNVVMFVAGDGRGPHFVDLLEREGDLKVIQVRDGSIPFEILAALERGEIVALHGDRALSQAVVRVPFLGSPAAFPTGPWQIAAATGAPVVPVFLVKTGWRRYRFETYEPIQVEAPRRDRARVIEEHVASFAKLVGTLAAMHPYQWFNFYNFWDE